MTPRLNTGYDKKRVDDCVVVLVLVLVLEPLLFLRNDDEDEPWFSPLITTRLNTRHGNFVWTVDCAVVKQIPELTVHL